MADGTGERKNWKQLYETTLGSESKIRKKASQGQAMIKEMRLKPVQRAVVDSAENFGGGFIAKLTDDLTEDLLPGWLPGGLGLGIATKTYAVSSREAAVAKGEDPGMADDLDALAAGMFGGEGYRLATMVSDSLMAMFDEK